MSEKKRGVVENHRFLEQAHMVLKLELFRNFSF
jgi:hypothetical protein